MSTLKKDNKFLSLLVILVSLFILIFFTKDIFDSMQENLDTRGRLTSEETEKSKELFKLSSLEKDLKDWNKKKEISRFLTSFSEDEILIYLYDYTEEINSENGSVFIKNIDFADDVTWELGFEELGVTLEIKATDTNILKTFLSFLTNENSKYSFYLTDFSFPNDNRSWSYDVTIPLRILHK